MALKSIKFDERKVKVTGGEVSVRGFGLDDILVLYARNAELMSQMFDSFERGELSSVPGLDDNKAMAIALVKSCPGMVAEAIALADGELDDESIAAAKKLPLSAQIECIQLIGTMTFESLGGPKNTLAAVIQMFNGMATTLSSLSD